MGYSCAVTDEQPNMAAAAAVAKAGELNLAGMSFNAGVGHCYQNPLALKVLDGQRGDSKNFAKRFLI